MLNTSYGAMKVYRERGVKAPFTFKLGTRGKKDLSLSVEEEAGSTWSHSESVDEKS
jgi:hypothetical protein